MPSLDFDSGPDFDDIDDFAGLLLAIVGFVALVLLVPVLLLVILVSVEFLALLLLLPFFVFARAAFGTPWIIVCRRDGEIVAEHAVRGWQASQDEITRLAAQMGENRMSIEMEEGSQ